MRVSSIVLLSGGLDSLASLHWAEINSDLVYGLTLNYGQMAAEKEVAAAKAICEHYDIRHKILELPYFKNLQSSSLLNSALVIPQLSANDLNVKNTTENSAKAVWIPNRNGVFINVAASLAEEEDISWVITGFNKEEAETFPDNSSAFVEQINKSLFYSTRNHVEVKALMGGKTKTEIVKWCVENGVDFKFLWSCYKNGPKMCGVCESCQRLKRALSQGGAEKIENLLFKDL